MTLPALPEAAPSYLAALIAANPSLALINQDALSGSSKPMPPSIVANKGKFTKKADGVEETICFPDNDQNRAAGIVGMPVPQLQAVILKGKPGKEKAYYVSKYTPGQEAQAPDCSSDDGIKPNADCSLKQCDNCASCPQNVFGSGSNADGTPSGGKACADKKVVAMYAAGSAYRFAIPPASLRNWDSYCAQLTTKGLPLPAVITIIGFEQGDTDYKLTYTFGGMLAEAQLGAIVKMIDTPEVKDIVSPRNASLAIAAPQETKQVDEKSNVVDLADKKAEQEAEAKKKDAAAKAAATKKANAEKAAEKVAASGGLDLGLGGDLGVGAAVAETTAGQPSDDDLINSLGL
jgi:hypothetical protein